MLKNCAKRKLIITTFSLLVFIITISFPKTEEKIKDISISYTNAPPRAIYVLNKDDLVVRMTTTTKETDDEKKIQELLNMLTIGSLESEYLPAIFKPIIPKETKIIDISLENEILKVNFSKEFLNIPNSNSKNLISSIVYTLTELDNVGGVLIYVEGNLLNSYPNTSSKLPNVLTRKLGINEISNLTDFKNTIKTTVYYMANEDGFSYYVPVTLLNNTNKDKLEIVIERLKSRPQINTNLMSYLNASTTISDSKLDGDTLTLNFNDELYEGLTSDDLKEQVNYAIVMSIKDSLDVSNVVIKET